MSRSLRIGLYESGDIGSVLPRPPQHQGYEKVISFISRAFPLKKAPFAVLILAQKRIMINAPVIVTSSSPHLSMTATAGAYMYFSNLATVIIPLLGIRRVENTACARLAFAWHPSGILWRALDLWSAIPMF